MTDYIEVPGTEEYAPWPTLYVPDCGYVGWKNIEGARGSDLTVAATTPGSDGMVATTTEGGIEVLLAEVFPSDWNAPQEVRFQYLEFTNQRNGEKYRVMVWTGGCY